MSGIEIRYYSILTANDYFSNKPKPYSSLFVLLLFAHAKHRVSHLVAYLKIVFSFLFSD